MTAPRLRIALGLLLSAALGCAVGPPRLLGGECTDDEDCAAGLACLDKRCLAPVLDAGPDVPPPPEDWHDLAYAHRSRVVIDNTGVNTSLVGVPVAVRIDVAHPGFEDVRESGIAFYSDDGDLLPHEFEFANQANARLWVRPDFIPPSTEENAGFWLYFRGPVTPDEVNAVWQDHVAVWHLGDPVDERYPDSAGVLNLSALNPQGTLDRVPGVIGNAVRLRDGAHLTGSRDIALHATGNQQRTYSLWASLAELGGEQTLLNKSNRTATCFGPYIETVGGTRLRAGYRSGPCDPNDVSDPKVDAVNELDPDDTAFHLYALVVNQASGQMRFYIDGVEQGVAALAGVDDGAQAVNSLFTIAAAEGARSWTGSVDEVRVSERTASAVELSFRFRTEIQGTPVAREVEDRDR